MQSKELETRYENFVKFTNENKLKILKKESKKNAK